MVRRSARAPVVPPCPQNGSDSSDSQGTATRAGPRKRRTLPAVQQRGQAAAAASSPPPLVLPSPTATTEEACLQQQHVLAAVRPPPLLPGYATPAFSIAAFQADCSQLLGELEVQAQPYAEGELAVDVSVLRRSPLDEQVACLPRELGSASGAQQQLTEPAPPAKHQRQSDAQSGRTDGNMQPDEAATGRRVLAGQASAAQPAPLQNDAQASKEAAARQTPGRGAAASAAAAAAAAAAASGVVAQVEHLKRAHEAGLGAAAQFLECVRLMRERQPAGQRPPVRNESSQPARGVALQPDEAAEGTGLGAAHQTASPAAELQLADDEVVVTVAVHKFDRPGQVLQEWALLGSQPLTALRDCIACPVDTNFGALGAAAPSAFVYIEGTFFNDRRHPDAVDLSAPVRAFCTTHLLAPPPPPPQGAPALGAGAATTEYRSESMEAVTWDQLWLRAGGGAGYVLCHQGCCEHLLVVTDVRRRHSSDPRQRSAYPLLTYQARRRKQRCHICGARFATQVTHHDVQAPCSPCLWCTECYRRLHYDQAGNLIYSDFKVFPYNWEV